MPRRTLADWNTIVEQQQQSGLSIVAFCKQQKLNTKSFYRSRRLIRDQDLPNKFLSVALTSVSEHKIVLELDNAKLYISLTCEPVWVAQLLKTYQA
ncbi:IS66 family insertion sequence element accessory protein TnpB [Alteromonas macleodii]|uniref:IS66 family insertion sequence element accessory protein TnpA n=1 Tax=Alteromonas macleodii TaxID=28108 RepID=UPI0030D18131